MPNAKNDLSLCPNCDYDCGGNCAEADQADIEASYQAKLDTEAAYITAHQNIIMAVSDCTKFVSSSLRDQVDYLEANMTDDQIDRLQTIARNTL